VASGPSVGRLGVGNGSIDGDMDASRSENSRTSEGG
jgi:hypothetical protein